jgi:hypothetical protein
MPEQINMACECIFALHGAVRSSETMSEGVIFVKAYNEVTPFMKSLLFTFTDVKDFTESEPRSSMILHSPRYFSSQEIVQN